MMIEPEKADFRVLEYPFHLGDLVGGTTNLNDEQFGAYMRILLANIQAQARKGGLPDNLEIIRSYTRMGPATFKKLWLLIGEKFVHENGKIFHPRVKETVNEIINLSNTKRANKLKSLETGATDDKQPQDGGQSNPKTQKPNNQESHIKTLPDSESDTRAGDKPSESGSGFSILEKGGRGGAGAPGGAARFDIEHHLDDKTRKTVKGLCREWDFYQLCQEYNQWIRGKGEVPDNPNAHFTAFAKKKGIRP